MALSPRFTQLFCPRSPTGWDVVPLKLWLRQCRVSSEVLLSARDLLSRFVAPSELPSELNDVPEGQADAEYRMRGLIEWCDRQAQKQISASSVPVPPQPAPVAAGTNQSAAPKGERTPKRMVQDEANAKAMKLAKADTRFAKAPTVRRWAKAIGCSTGLVVKLPFWLECQKRLGKSNRSAKPKSVSLTDGVTATLGQNDPELERLIGEQKTDDKGGRRRASV